jgi:hypothetical protein
MSKKNCFMVAVLLVFFLQTAWSDVERGYECQSDGPYDGGDNGLRGLEQSDLGLDPQGVEDICPGEWVVFTATGGNDCDNKKVGDGPISCPATPPVQCTSDQVCAHVYDNRDSQYNIEVTGNIDRVVHWSSSTVTPLLDKVAVEAHPWHTDGGDGPIHIEVAREEATTKADPADEPVAEIDVNVVMWAIKLRTLGYSWLVTPPSGFDSWEFAVLAWSFFARRDDDMPSYVPGGADTDVHECVDYVISSKMVDYGIPEPYPYYYPQEGTQMYPYNIVIVDEIYEVFFPRNVNGFGERPGCHIVLDEDMRTLRTWGHEWGHNGGLSDDGDGVVPWSIMSVPADQDNILPSQFGSWTSQTSSEYPAGCN